MNTAINVSKLVAEVNGLSLKNALQKVKRSMPQDNDMLNGAPTRPNLKAVAIEVKDNCLQTIATDGYHLAADEIMCFGGNETRLAIPRDYVETVIGFLDDDLTQIFADNTTISFQAGLNELEVPISEYEYPDIKKTSWWDQIPEKCAVLKRDALSWTSRAYTKKDLLITDLEIIFEKEATIKVAKYEDIQEKKFGYSGQNPPQPIIVNPSFIRNALKAINDKEIVVRYAGGHTPVIVHSAKSKYPIFYIMTKDRDHWARC